MANKNKEKGKRFEEEVTKILREVFRRLYPKMPDHLLPTRNLSSGTKKELDGDIDLRGCYMHFPFTIECKHRKDIKIENLLNGVPSVLKKAYKQAQQGKATPLVVFRGHRTDIYCMTEVYLENIPRIEYTEGLFIYKFKSFVLEYLLRR
jgi:hypothetical protein